jgi:hypothetical protein
MNIWYAKSVPQENVISGKYFELTLVFTLREACSILYIFVMEAFREANDILAGDIDLNLIGEIGVILNRRNTFYQLFLRRR